jgi:hypothetical protein
MATGVGEGSQKGQSQRFLREGNEDDEVGRKKTNMGRPATPTVTAPGNAGVPWSFEEDNLLLELKAEVNDWDYIAQEVSKISTRREASECRERHNAVVEQRADRHSRIYNR